MKSKMPHSIRNSNNLTINEYTATLMPPPPKAELALMWQDLEARSDGTFFQTWLYVSCYYEERFPQPLLLRLERCGEVMALALFNHKVRANLLNFFYLHETGTALWDSLFIEQNAPLCARNAIGAEAACFTALLKFARLRHFLPTQYRLSGINDTTLATARASGTVLVEVTRPAWAVDLTALRAKNEDYMTTLSPNTRHQLRRSMRHYQEAGPITITRAEGPFESKTYFLSLIKQHQMTWTSRGQSGAFATREFQSFHEELISLGTTTRSIDILRISAGDRIIGYLLNFIHQGHVYTYQSGFNYNTLHPHEKPGLTCHAVAIMQYLREGYNLYDFLGGDARYKASFGNLKYHLHWAWLAPCPSSIGTLYKLKSLLNDRFSRP